MEGAKPVAWVRRVRRVRVVKEAEFAQVRWASSVSRPIYVQLVLCLPHTWSKALERAYHGKSHGVGSVNPCFTP